MNKLLWIGMVGAVAVGLMATAQVWEFPLSIRVLLTAPALGQLPGECNRESRGIIQVSFQEYVRNVLPNEWGPVSAFADEALKAGAMAAKTYAWYRVMGRAKYPGQGYDVRDDICDQVYRPGSAILRTDRAIEATWPWVMTRGGQLFESQYDSGTRGRPEPLYPGRMSQWGTQYWAEQGKDWRWMLRYYYGAIEIHRQITPRQP
jgi:peptidoglycan hydrolase-like amidase